MRGARSEKPQVSGHRRALRYALDVSALRQAVAEDRYLITVHAKQRMGQRRVSEKNLKHVIIQGDVVESTPMHGLSPKSYSWLTFVGILYTPHPLCGTQSAFLHIGGLITACVLSIVAADVLYRIVERPTTQLGRKLSQKILETSPSTRKRQLPASTVERLPVADLVIEREAPSA